MANFKCSPKGGMGGSNGGAGRSSKTAVYKTAGRKLRRRMAKKEARNALLGGVKCE